MMMMAMTMVTMMMMMMMMMYTLWGGCSPPLLPSLELFPREKISLSIPLEVFSPDDDGCDDDDDRVDRQLVRMGYRFLVGGCKEL